MVTGFQEVGCLVIFIQNFDLEVGERRQGVTIVLLCLDGGGRIIEPLRLRRLTFQTLAYRKAR